MKEHVNEFTVPLTYFRIHLDAGKAANGKKTEALVSSCCVLDVLARDADAVVAGNLGEYTERKFLNDPDVHGRTADAQPRGPPQSAHPPPHCALV